MKLQDNWNYLILQIDHQVGTMIKDRPVYKKPQKDQRLEFRAAKEEYKADKKN